MPSQRFRLEAEMRDNASPAVKKLRQELAALQEQTSETRAIAKLNKEIGQLRKESGEFRATPGMAAFTNWTKEAGARATGFAASIKDIPGILSGLGIGGLAAGASVAALSSELKKLGEDALAIKELSRETGLSKEFIAAWAGSAAHFQVAGDAAKQMLDVFASQLPDFERSTGVMYRAFSQWPDVTRRIQQDIREHNPSKALRDALDQLEQVGRERGPEVQKQFAESLFPGHGTDAIKMLREGISGLRTEMAKPWAVPDENLTKQAQALTDASSKFGNELTKLENIIGPDFLAGMTKGIEGLTSAIAALEVPFKWMHDFFSKSDGDWNKDHNPGGRYGTAPPRMQAAPPDAKSLMPRNREAAPDDYHYRRNDGHSLLHKSSYSDGDDFRSMLQLASYSDGAGSGTGSGTTENAVAEGSKAGVLQAFRELQIEQDIKNKALGLGGDGGGPGGGGGGNHFGGRQGLEARMGTPSGEGGRPFKGDAGVGHWWTPERVKHAVDRLVKEGHLSQAGAEGLVSRWATVEAAGGPTAVNPKSGAWGIGQWLGARGHGKTTDFDGQLSKAIGELNGSESRAAAKLRSAQNAHDGAVGASMYERAEHYNARSGVDDWTSKSESGAAAIHGMINGSLGSPDVGKLGALHVLNEQCVSLAKAAVGATGSVKEWHKGVGALEGTMKPGTPVATFLDRAGHLVDRYAGGGTGTPGSHLDHAGIFQSYIRDGSGKIIGMNIAEQYKGSHGVHSKAYYNRGWGEANASNYAAIRGPDGSYLGGANNPMNRSEYADRSLEPNAHRRADRHLGDQHARGGGGDSNHLLTIDLRDPGGQVRSTRISRDGPMKVDVRNRWKTGQSPLVQA